MWASFALREDQFAGMAEGTEILADIPALKLSKQPFKVYFISPADFATWRATKQSVGYDVRSFEVRTRPVQPIAGFAPWHERAVLACFMSFGAGVVRAYQDEWQFCKARFGIGAGQLDSVAAAWHFVRHFVQAVPRALPIVVVDLSQGR